jgi:hypothetical protein
MYMRDVEADTYASYQNQNDASDVSAHYLDMSIFKAALDIGGYRWFLESIVEEVLAAGQAGGAVRAGMSICKTGKYKCYYLAPYTHLFS